MVVIDFCNFLIIVIWLIILNVVCFLVDVKDLVNQVFMEVLLMFNGPQKSAVQESLQKNSHRESKYDKFSSKIYQLLTVNKIFDGFS